MVGLIKGAMAMRTMVGEGEKGHSGFRFLGRVVKQGDGMDVTDDV